MAWSHIMPPRINRTNKLNLRLTPEAKRTLTAAANAQRRSLSKFVLESALGRAEEALADRRVSQLPPKEWKAFIAAIDAPPRDLPRMRELLKDPTAFTRGNRA
jgi:uncharacterized protein (DUF1778 family)